MLNRSSIPQQVSKKAKRGGCNAPQYGKPRPNYKPPRRTQGK